ncbi:MAG: hypothetical protein WBN75_13340 [Verrucomicrobiia bacterium]|jgi:hypothetical protein
MARIFTVLIRVNPSSAVRQKAVLIFSGLAKSSPGFLHYIFDRILNNPALFGKGQAQSL